MSKFTEARPGGLYNDLEEQERIHVQGFDVKTHYGGGFTEGLKELISAGYSGFDELQWSCTAVQYKLTKADGTLILSELVFCFRAVENALMHMLFYTLASLCVHLESDILLVDPIPSVRKLINESNTWVVMGSDLRLPLECLKTMAGTVPANIRQTGCMVTYSEYQLNRQSGRWDVTLPELSEDEKKYIAKSIRTIDEEYLTGLECLLYRLNLYAKNKPEYCIPFKTDAAMVTLDIDDDDNLVLQYIAVRPRLQGLSIGTTILFCLIDACVRNGIKKFIVRSAHSSSVGLMSKFGGFRSKGGSNDVDSAGRDVMDYYIKLKDMKTKTMEGCGINMEWDAKHGLFVLDHDAFPASRELKSKKRR
jgi:hypothetical protein